MQVFSIKAATTSDIPPSSYPKQKVSKNNAVGIASSDKFCKGNNSPNFTGKQFPSGFYDDAEIKFAKKYIYLSGFAKYIEFDVKHAFKGLSSWEIAGKVDSMTRLINDLKEVKAEKAAEAADHAKWVGKQLKKKRKKAEKLEEKAEELEQKIARQERAAAAQKTELEKKLAHETKLIKVKDILTDKFTTLSKIEKTIQNNASLGRPSNISFPNGVMITGLNKNESIEIMDWTAIRSGSNLRTIDFATLNPNEALKEIGGIAKSAQDLYNKANQRTIIHIKNFDKFATPVPINENIIGKLKAFLSCCSEKYKCTVISDVENPAKLSPEIIADHRFQVKINIPEISEPEVVKNAQPVYPTRVHSSLLRRH